MAKTIQIARVCEGIPSRTELIVDVDLPEKQIGWLSMMPDCDEKEGLLNMLGDIAWLAEGEEGGSHGS